MNDPDDPSALHVNLKGALLDPAAFDGPLNELIQLHGTAVAANTVEATKAAYDANNPPIAAVERSPIAPLGRPIGCGHKIRPDMSKSSKYVIDTSVSDRVNRRPRG